MSDHKTAKQKYPIGTPVEVRMNGEWHPATVYGQAGEYIIARAEGYWYDEYNDEDVRPIRSECEQKGSAAQKSCAESGGGEMSLFTELAERQFRCELCGGETIALYGGGWDNDRIYCRDVDCGAEYVFPTTTTIDTTDE